MIELDAESLQCPLGGIIRTSVLPVHAARKCRLGKACNWDETKRQYVTD